MIVTMVLEGSPAVIGQFQRLRAVMTRSANLSGWNQTQHLFARTRAVVPYLKGDLYDAAYMANISPSETQFVWVVGYDTVAVGYAMTVHETPNRHHPTRGPSREAKQDHFLSEPRDAMESSYVRTVRDDVAEAIRGIGR